MSLILPAIGATAALIHLARNYDSRREAMEAEREQHQQSGPPFRGRYRPHSSVAATTRSARDITNVYPDVDTRGVPYYHVQYRNGALVKQYGDPYAHY